MYTVLSFLFWDMEEMPNDKQEKEPRDCTSQRIKNTPQKPSTAPFPNTRNVPTDQWASSFGFMITKEGSACNNDRSLRIMYCQAE